MVAVAERADAGRGCVLAQEGRGFFYLQITQHVRSLPVLYDLLTLAATFLSVLLWGLCLFLWG